LITLTLVDSGQIVGERGGTAFPVPLPFLAGERRSPSLRDRCGWTRGYVAWRTPASTPSSASQLRTIFCSEASSFVTL